jgi:YD repeat-containing protein
VPAGARYDPGGSQWRERTTEGERSVDRSWWRDGSLYRVTVLERGKRISITDHHRNGVISHLWEYADECVVAERGWYEDGALAFERFSPAGQPERSTHYSPSGMVEASSEGVWRATYHANGQRSSERALDDTTTYFAEDGRVTATEVPDKRKDVYWRRELDANGRVIAEGRIDLRTWGANGAVGPWRLYTRDGTLRGEAELSRLERPPRKDIAAVAEQLLAWQALPRARWLRGADAVGWSRYKVYFGSAADLPFHLNGLSAESDAIFDLAYRNLHNALFHQGTVSQAAKAAAPFLIGAAASIAAPHRDRLLHLIADIGRAPKTSAVKAVRAELAKRLARWAALTAAGDVWAARVLGLAAHAKNAKRVLAAAMRAKDPVIRAEITLALGHSSPEAKRWLRGELSGDERQRLCAAITLGRFGDRSTDVTDVLIAALAAPPAGYDDLYWAGRAVNDICGVLGQLGVGLPLLLSAFAEARTLSAIGIASAMLTLAFGGNDPSSQRAVLRAIAERDEPWGYVNLKELLRAWDLPEDREALLAHLP